LADAPSLPTFLTDQDRQHLRAVQDALTLAGVEYQLDPTLVRGLDYYTSTVFEFTCDRLGTQSGVAGGGRYDGLIELLGGPSTPAAGWAAGVERIALAMGKRRRHRRPDLYLVAEGPARVEALRLAAELRDAALHVDFDLLDRSVNSQMKHAARLGARYVLFVHGSQDLVLRDLRSRHETPLLADHIVEEIKGWIRGTRDTPRDTPVPF
jgi:histidyl-tRNA synthetase